jgi:hypothetical protein
LQPRPALAIAIVLAAVAVGGAARASPFLIRYSGSNTALAIDQGSIAARGPFKAAWTYVFYRKGSIWVRDRMQIFGRRQIFDCRRSAEKDLATVGYADNGRIVARSGADAHWTIDLSGSNTAIVVNTVCDGPDAAWTRVAAPSVFAAFRQTWK